MSPVNKRLYIITTRSINKNGFLNDSVCEKKEVSVDSPVMQFLIDDIDMALVSWITALKEKQDNDTLQQIMEMLNINDLSLLDYPDSLIDFITEDNRKNILHKFSSLFTEFERSFLNSPVEKFNSTSYLEKDFDGGRIIALPHLIVGRNCCMEDNRKWIDSLIKSFANENE